MKITLSTAMRARDVSRPRDEHLAEAAEREAALAHPAPLPPAQPGAAAPSGPEPARRDEAPVRRRRRRGR